MTQREAWDRWHERHEVESTSPEYLLEVHAIGKDLDAGAVFLDVGVGVGDMARHVAGTGATVDCVDISPIAGAQVLDVARRFYLADEIESLPSDEYDVALSHLVAQHTIDAEFTRQIGNIYRALIRGGTYSVQFAGSDLGDASRVLPSETEVGHVVRAPGDAILLCKSACPGARVALVRPPERWPSTNTGDHTFYYYLHVDKP